MTKASVVILTRNSEDWLIDVLESVGAQTCPRDWLETIIIDLGSTDATTALARFYLARHGMRGGLHTADPAMGLAGAMNVGWQTAAGDWIQVIKSPGRLAPDKIQVQLDFVAQLSQSTRAVFSNWQLLQKNGKVWLASGPVNQVAIPAPPYLRLVAPHAPPLGAALLQRQALVEVGGFPEALSFAGDENLLLRFAGMHENTRASRGRFVVAPSAAPLYFEREAAARVPPLRKAKFAREHLDNLMIARAMLRDHQLGMLTWRKRAKSRNSAPRVCAILRGTTGERSSNARDCYARSTPASSRRRCNCPRPCRREIRHLRLGGCRPKRPG